MPFVTVPKDLTKVKTKVLFGLTKRQIICFGSAAAVGIPVYLLTRGIIGNSAGVIFMIVLMLPFFFMAMYEKDGQPAEKIIRNIIRARYFFPKVRPYKTQNIYAEFAFKPKPPVREGRYIAVKNKETGTTGTASQRKYTNGSSKQEESPNTEKQNKI